MIYIWLILLIAILAWREVQILIDRGSWKKEDYRNIFWHTDWKSKWKNWDSFHVSNGLATLIVLILLVPILPSVSGQVLGHLGVFNVLIDIPIYWLIWVQIRNLFMHVVFKRR